MYTKFDLLSPVLSRYKRGNKFKREFMRTWPTMLVPDTDATGLPTGSDVEVMSIFVFWNGSNGKGSAVETDQAKKIYKLIGVSVDKINAKSENGGLKGVNQLWYKIVPWKTHQDASIAEITTVVNRYSTTKKRIFTFKDTDIDLYRNIESKDQIAILKNKLNTTNVEKIDYDMKYNDQWLALLDVDEEIYDININANGRGAIMNSDGTLKDKNKYGQWYSFTIDYSLKSNYNVSIAIETRTNNQKAVTITEDDGYGGTTRVNCEYALTKQKNEVYSLVSNDIIDSKKFVQSREYGDDEMSDSYTIVNQYVRKSYLDSLPAVISQATKINHNGVKFSDEVGKMIGTDYEKTPVAPWKQVLGILLLFIAIIATVLSDGATSPEVAAAYAYLALAVSISLGVLAYNEAEYGNPNAAAMYGDMLTIVGYVGAFLGLNEILNNLVDKGVDAILEKYAEMSTLELVSTTINYSSKIYDYVAKQQMQSNNKKVSEMQEKVNQQKLMMDKMPTAMKYAVAKWNFESYNFLEINEKMDQVPYNMTQGLIDGATHKYF